MKQLSNLAIAELEIKQNFAGKTAAFIPIYLREDIGDRKAELGLSIKSALNGTKLAEKPGRFGVGIAVANEPGYTPINGWWCSMPTYDKAVEEATRLSGEVFGLDQAAMMDIHASSMVASKLRQLQQQ